MVGELTSVKDVVHSKVISKVRARNLARLAEVRKALGPVARDGKEMAAVAFPHQGLPVLKELSAAATVSVLFVLGLLASLRTKPDLIYAHNVECGLAALALGKVRSIPVTVDLHGDEVEENVSLNGWTRGGARHRLWTRIEGFVATRSGKIVCVSEKHREMIESQYGRRGTTVVVPCCTEEVPSDKAQSTALARELELPNKSGPVLLYAGSASKHQCVERMAEFADAVSASGTSLGILMLAPDAESRAAFERLASGRRWNAWVRSVRHDLVLPASMNADIALLFRSDITLNRISSPTKFAEYLMAGLPVLISPNVGDYSKAVDDHKLGKVVDPARLADPGYCSGLVKDLMDDRQAGTRCRRFALENLTWRANMPALLQAFGLAK